jgi:hypothetical protein
MKKYLGAGLPLVLIHFICCGALLFWLIGSGYLLAMSNEGQNQVFFWPVLVVVTGLVFLYRYHTKCCKLKQKKTYIDYALQFIIYSLIVIILSIAFMVYIYIPWWIPDYKGGMLLP